MNLIKYVAYLASYAGGELFGPSHKAIELVTLFIATFPVVLSIVWSVSAIYGLILRRFSPLRRNCNLQQVPSFSILVPFCGDGHAVEKTVASLQAITPAPDKIILIDDGSPTESRIAPSAFSAAGQISLLRLPQNVGKAQALNRALCEVHSEVVVCLDSDTVASTRDWSGMLGQFTTDRNLGAVTGKIWPVAIRNIAQLFQAIDYLAVICLVKSAECVWGGLTTVSGAWVAYRRKALEECGGWNRNTSAEDIDLSWRLQARGWRLSYDGKWTACVEMLPSWRSLWLQRRRWSSGLGRTMREQLSDAFRRGARHLPVACVAVVGTLWVWTVLAAFCVTMVEALSHHHLSFLMVYLATKSHFDWSLYSEAFFLQLMVAFSTDGGRWRQYPLMLLCAAFYPLYFWMILFTTFVVGFPIGFRQVDNGRWRAVAAERDEALA